MSEFNLRKATIDDHAEIKKLIREVQINPLGLKWQRFVVIQLKNNGVVACGQIKHHRDQTKELASIAVIKAFRGKGLAKLIIESLLNSAESPIWLMCQSNLVPFYQQFNFLEVTNTSSMPSALRLPHNLVGILRKITRDPTYLAIMRWDGAESAENPS